MKKILFLFSILCLTSCDDILKEQTKSLAVETFYNTAAEVDAAVNAIYTPLRSNNSDT